MKFIRNILLITFFIVRSCDLLAGPGSLATPDHQLDFQTWRAQQAEASHTHWQHLQELYAPPAAEAIPTKTESQTPDEQQIFLNAFSQLSEVERSKIACGLFEKLDTENSSDALSLPKIMDDTTYRDLEIFSGKPGECQHNFVARTKRTYTSMGTAAYLNLLYSPTTNTDILKARQQGLHELVNGDLYSALAKKLKYLAQTESRVLALWSPQTTAACTSLRQFYVKDPVPALGSELLQKKLQSTNVALSKKANESATYLDAKRLFELVTKPAFDITFGFFNMSGEFYSMLEKKPLALLLDPRGIERVALNAALFAGTYYMPDEYRLNTFRVTSGGSMLYWMARSYKELFTREKCVLALHQITREIASSVRTMQEIIDLVKNNEALSTAVDTQHSFHFSKDPDLLACLATLTSDYFKKEPSLLGLRGTALATFAQLREVKEKLIPLYAYVGAVDALVSIATLMKESADKPASYSFAQYETMTSAPRLEVLQFWNPFIEGEPITNSITLTGNNALLTGPNAGGKSTTLQAATLCALLAQTFGATPGQTRLSPFRVIMTLRNMGDTTGQKSGFQAHTLRAKDLLENLKKLPADECAFVVPDELFNTTEQESATRICKKLFTRITNKHPNALFIAATHFPTLSSLEEETEGRVVNYKMGEATIDGDAIHWPYTLERGVNKQNIAAYVIRQALREIPCDDQSDDEDQE
jgi:hypothetical protein